jgi:hypothetical protein
MFVKVILNLKCISVAVEYWTRVVVNDPRNKVLKHKLEVLIMCSLNTRIFI